MAGRNPVVESLRARVPAATLYVGARVARDERVDEAIKLAADRGVPVLEAGPAELDRLTGGALHQGLALRVRAYDYAHPDDLLARAADAGQVPLIVALDSVTDPRNLGAIVRSAAAFGAHGVVVPARRGAGVTAGAWKASAGALARLPVARAANLARALQSYRDAGVFVAGLDAAGEVTIRDLDLATAPLVLVTGSEGKGLSRIVAQTCDVLVRIPIAASTESLNAGVATGIALYEVAAVRSGYDYVPGRCKRDELADGSDLPLRSGTGRRLGGDRARVRRRSDHMAQQAGGRGLGVQVSGPGQHSQRALGLRIAARPPGGPRHGPRGDDRRERPGEQRHAGDHARHDGDRDGQHRADPGQSAQAQEASAAQHRPAGPGGEPARPGAPGGGRTGRGSRRVLPYPVDQWFGRGVAR